MSIAAIIFVILLGLLFLILEILVLPGGVVGTIGAGMMVWAVVDAYRIHGSMAGNITLVSVIVLVALSIWYILKSGTWKRLTLSKELDGKSGVNLEANDFLKEGTEGETITRLNPMGKAMFEGKIFEVSVQDGFLDEHTKVIVKRIKGNKIIVKRINI